MEREPYKLLLHGIDTVQCAYFLVSPPAQGIPFAHLGMEKEMLRHSKSREPKAVTLGGMEFMLHPYGSPSGYPFVLTNEDFKIELGEFNTPSCFVTFRSQGLWRDTAAGLHEKFLRWGMALGLVPHRPEGLSRVDFSFDYHVPTVDFTADAFVSLSTKDSQHRENGTMQTFTLGKGDIVLRVYDKVAEVNQKSAKVWFYDLWGQSEHVWRIEWQVRKPLLRSAGITTMTDLYTHQGTLLRYLAEEHDTLRCPTSDSNRSRWPLHPLWEDLQQRIRALPTLEHRIQDGQFAVLEERLMRMTISIYGYLKRIAAMECVQNRQPMLTVEEAIAHLGTRVHKVHERMTWEADVRHRIKAIELGE
ncbi:MAG: hypothetical protein EPO61_05295 [Nitrospirae bacterium]|nr:MAG: hypothetical protein EPO61_05295 [Nitrospirota bacterium]